MNDPVLVSDVRLGLYLHDIDADTLRLLGDMLTEYADIRRVWESGDTQKEMRFAGSEYLRLWGGRFRTDANRLEDADFVRQAQERDA